MTTQDEILTSAPPAHDADTVAGWVARHWGLRGRLDRLTSERDLNHRLRCEDGRSLVVKLANRAEPPAVTNFQTEALLHIARTAPDLPVPRVVPALDGRVEIALPGGEVMRLLSWVEGEPMHSARPSAALRQAVGRTAARLTRALEGFEHPAAGHELLWDIKNAARLRPMLAAIADPALRAEATRRLDHFDATLAPALPALPWQVVHADLNPHNLMTGPGGQTITGILDFGDMVRTPRICDLAVAASYRTDPAAPLQSLSDVIGAWHGVLPLTGAEAEVVLDLVAIRMVTTLALASWRAARYPDNAAYILRNLPASGAGLMALVAHGTGRKWSPT
ncbi:MAG: phosphotransferase [Paracoccaceae bacterium]